MQPNTPLCWGGTCGATIPSASPSHPHLIPQHPARSPALPGGMEGPGTAGEEGWQTLTPFGDRFFRSGQVLVSVPRFHCGQGQPPLLGASRHTHRAVLPAKPAHRYFRFPLAACSGLGREEGVFILFLFIGSEGRETPSALLCYATRTGAALPRL